MFNRNAILSLVVAATMPIMAGPAPAQDIDWAAVGKALGKEGTVQSGGVYRIGLPRTDLKVTLDGISLNPAFALGGWLGFEPMGKQAMVMGDLVLLEGEVNPVMKKLEEAGIEITALHNHLLRSSPTTMYMHVQGEGDPMELAKALHDALVLSKTPFAASAPLESTPAIDTVVEGLDQIMKAHAKTNGGVVQYSFPRAEKITDGDMPVPPAMGSATAINFQLTGNGKAEIAGDFVLLAQEVNPVLRVLRDNGIEVTAIHSHMLAEEPRLYFMHFWASDEAQKLAKGLRSALDKLNLQKS